MKNNKNHFNREHAICYLGFAAEFIIIAFCYAFRAVAWADSAYMTAVAAMIQSGAILLILLTASLLVCIFFSGQTAENKFLFMIGCIAVSLGILGYSESVMQGKLTFLDATYRSIQFFVGEFDSGIFTRIPPFINAARFLALAVTFGAIGIILLKKKIYCWNIRLFYKDIVIITDRPEAYITDLAKKFTNDNRKVVIGYTANDGPSDRMLEGNIPSVTIDINKDISFGLNACNIKNARNIFLLCEATEDNIKLLKAIYPMFRELKKPASANTGAKDERKPPAAIDDLIQTYCDLVKSEPREAAPAVELRQNKTICYVRYQTDQEREYYSIDDVFTNRIDNFDTYFINIYDISVRQMLTRISAKTTLGISSPAPAESVKEKLDAVRIAVAGSGEILSRTVLEIAKNCVYNDRSPMKIYHLTGDGTPRRESAFPSRLDELVEVETVTARQLRERSETINLLFVSTTDEKEVRMVLQDVFQYDLQDHIREYMILTKGDTVEYDILHTYINTLLRPYVTGKKAFVHGATMHISRIVNLMLTIEQFYRRFGPTSREIHEAYKRAIVNDELCNFNDLPEIYIDSNILSALHNNFIMEIVNAAIKSQGSDVACGDSIRELFEYLASTEHERWYNERRLQGCIYSEEQSRIYHKNSNLLHWNALSKKQKEGNINYVVGALIAQYQKGIGAAGDDIYKGFITSYFMDGNDGT